MKSNKIIPIVFFMIVTVLFMAMSYDVGYVNGIKRKGRYVKQVKIDTVYKWIPEK